MRGNRLAQGAITCRVAVAEVVNRQLTRLTADELRPELLGKSVERGVEILKGVRSVEYVECSVGASLGNSVGNKFNAGASS